MAYSLRDVTLQVSGRWPIHNGWNYHRLIPLSPTRCVAVYNSTYYVLKHSATGIELIGTGSINVDEGQRISSRMFLGVSGARTFGTYWVNDDGTIDLISENVAPSGWSGYGFWMPNSRNVVRVYHSNYVDQRGGGYSGEVQYWQSYRVFNDGTFYQLASGNWNVNNPGYFPNNYAAKGFTRYGNPLRLDENTSYHIGNVPGYRDNWVGIYNHQGRAAVWKYNTYTGAMTWVQPQAGVHYDWGPYLDGIYSGGINGAASAAFRYSDGTRRAFTIHHSHDNNQGSDRTPTRVGYYNPADDTWSTWGTSQNNYRQTNNPSATTDAVWGARTQAMCELKDGLIAHIDHDDQGSLDYMLGPTYVNIWEPEAHSYIAKQTIYIPEEQQSDPQAYGVYLDIQNADDKGDFCWMTWGTADGKQMVGILMRDGATLPTEGAAPPLRLVQRDDGGRTGPRVQPGSVQAQTTSAQASERIVGFNTYDGRGAGGGGGASVYDGDALTASDPEKPLYLRKPITPIGCSYFDDVVNNIMPESDVRGVTFRKIGTDLYRLTYDIFFYHTSDNDAHGFITPNCQFQKQTAYGGEWRDAYKWFNSFRVEPRVYDITMTQADFDAWGGRPQYLRLWRERVPDGSEGLYALFKINTEVFDL